MSEMVKQVIDLLSSRKEQIATMESCTGGGVVNWITNIPGASEVLLFSAVTYSNEFKIKLGVSKETIDQYTVYSIETAKQMAHAISLFSHSDYGVGITGTLNRYDPNNDSKQKDLVYIAIYDQKENVYDTKVVQVTKCTREENKEQVIANTFTMIKQMLIEK